MQEHVCTFVILHVQDSKLFDHERYVSLCQGRSFKNDWLPHPLASKAEIKVANIVGLTWLHYHSTRITVKPAHIQACLFEDDVNAMLKESDERWSCWWVGDEHAGIVEPSWPHLPLPRESRSHRAPHYFKPCILYDVFLATMILGSQL